MALVERLVASIAGVQIFMEETQMSESDVKIWQHALEKLTFYTGVIDGDFGPGTRRASFEAVNIKDSFEVPTGLDVAALSMINQQATRNRHITENLQENLVAAATAVYGSSCKIAVYSGGQDRRGQGNRRTGSVRHDDYGEGGRAADCYVYVGGKKIFGVELAKLGQYWLAMGYGACGLEMATGGIHLDEWTTPPPGGGMFWTYKYSDGKPWGATVRQMLVDGSRGDKPK